MRIQILMCSVFASCPVVLWSLFMPRLFLFSHASVLLWDFTHTLKTCLQFGVIKPLFVQHKDGFSPFFFPAPSGYQLKIKITNALETFKCTKGMRKPENEGEVKLYVMCVFCNIFGHFLPTCNNSRPAAPSSALWTWVSSVLSVVAAQGLTVSPPSSAGQTVTSSGDSSPCATDGADPGHHPASHKCGWGRFDAQTRQQCVLHGECPKSA